MSEWHLCARAVCVLVAGDAFARRASVLAVLRWRSLRFCSPAFEQRVVYAAWSAAVYAGTFAQDASRPL